MSRVEEILREARSVASTYEDPPQRRDFVARYLALRCADLEAERDEAQADLAQFLVQDEQRSEAHGDLLLECDALRARSAEAEAAVTHCKCPVCDASPSDSAGVWFDRGTQTTILRCRSCGLRLNLSLLLPTSRPEPRDVQVVDAACGQEPK